MASRESLLHNGNADTAYNSLSDDSSSSSSSPLASLLTSLRTHKKPVLIALIALLVVLVVAVIAYLLFRSSDEPPSPPPYEPWLTPRLPGDVSPTFYDLDLTIDIPRLAFSGLVNISLHATRSTPAPYIVLHSARLSIDAVTLIDGVSGRTENCTFFLYPQNEYLVVRPSSPLSPNVSSTLLIAFHAPLNNSLVGLYYSTYQSPTRGAVTIATTQFEPTDARRAFPCFDEPAMKAAFLIRINAPNSSPTTLSNMAPASRTPTQVGGSGEWYRTVFGVTPVMSTYLIAFIVCDFNSTVAVTSRGTVVRTWAAPEKVYQTVNATDIGWRQTQAYEQIFGVNFPLSKQDMVAIPDFAAGAMENWGLITYRETALLYDPVINSDAELQAIARVIAHELAHQWFGNLVTMKWWSDIWLNEGFASWVMWLGVEAVYPTWQGVEQFVTDTAAAAYNLDSLPVPSTHPLVDDAVVTPDQIATLFDSISYNKGACLIQHMVGILTLPVFLKAISSYLVSYAYSNADSVDLMHQLSVSSGYPVASLMSTYLTQPNYPVVIVSETTGPNYTATFDLSQRRFLSPFGSPEDASVTWDIPISYTMLSADGSTYTNNTALHWLYANQTSVALPLTFDYTASWYLKVNHHNDFFYRVQYPHIMWDRFAEVLVALSPSALSVKDRTSLISDAFALAYSGMLPWKFAMNLTQYATAEDSLTVWTELISQLDALRPFFAADGADALTEFSTYVGVLLRPRYDLLIPPTPADHVTNILAGRVFGAAARYGLSDAREWATMWFSNMTESGWMVQPWPDVASTVYTVGVVEAGDEAWDAVRVRYSSTTSATEAARCLQALAAVKDEVKLLQLLALTLDGTIRSQDAATVMVAVCYNNWTLFYTWLTTYWSEVNTLFSSGYSGFKRVLDALVGSVQLQTQLDGLRGFFAQKDLGASAAGYDAAVGQAMKNIAFRNGDYQQVKAWVRWFVFEQQPPSAAASQ